MQEDAAEPEPVHTGGGVRPLKIILVVEVSSNKSALADIDDSKQRSRMRARERIRKYFAVTITCQRLIT
jgi:hypothetical protein